MNKAKFFERYKDLFHTNNFTDTYNAYKSLSEQERKKLASKALSESGKKWHATHKEEFSNAMKGHKVSQETKEKISKANTEYYKDQNNRNKTSEAIKRAFKEKPRSKESHQRQAESLRKAYQEHPEIKQKISESLKQHYKDPEFRKMISERTKKAMAEFYKTAKGQENLKKWTDGSRAKGTSIPEKEIQNFVSGIYKDEIIFNDRKLLNGKELDIYIPGKKVAIEYNGDIWHSEAYKENAKKVHFEKTLLCEKLGIRLIHIFSDEWELKQEIVKSLIASSLGVYQKKYFARKLEFKEIDMYTAKQFFNENHIQGFTGANKYYGLFDKDTLVQAASFGIGRFSKDSGQTELIRMASLLNTQVVGGFSKLMKNSSYLECCSYVDRRLFNSAGYLASGWKKIGESEPRYFYTNGKTRENRQTYMKRSCLKRWPECTTDMTEHEMCLMHGLYRIYDCGTIKMKWELR